MKITLRFIGIGFVICSSFRAVGRTTLPAKPDSLINEVDFYIGTGKTYKDAYITHQQIMDGGTLNLIMGPEPSDFGTKKKNRPFSAFYNDYKK